MAICLWEAQKRRREDRCKKERVWQEEMVWRYEEREPRRGWSSGNKGINTGRITMGDGE